MTEFCSVWTNINNILQFTAVELSVVLIRWSLSPNT